MPSGQNLGHTALFSPSLFRPPQIGLAPRLGHIGHVLLSWGHRDPTGAWRVVCAPLRGLRRAAPCPGDPEPAAPASSGSVACSPSSWWPQSWKEEVGRSARAWGNPNGLEVSGYKRGLPAGGPEPCPTMTPSHRPSSPAPASALLAALLAGEWAVCPPVRLPTCCRLWGMSTHNTSPAPSWRRRGDRGGTWAGHAWAECSQGREGARGSAGALPQFPHL